MKKLKLITVLFLLLSGTACKETTIVREEYNPPAPKLHGTWKLVNTNNQSFETYYVFSENGSNLAYILTKDTNGFTFKETYTYKADDKLVYVFNGLYNYELSNDTLYIKPNGSTSTICVKVATPTFTPENWTSNVSVMKRLSMPRGASYNTIRPFGIDGDILYLCASNTMGYYVFKYNTVTNTYSDSISVPNPPSVCYKSPSVYYGFQANNKIYKTTGLALPTSAVSMNDINYTQALSINPNSGVIYAMESSSALKAGTDGSNFNTIFTSGTYNLANILYFQNDEFLALRNSAIVKFKISPKVLAVKSYNQLPNFYSYVLSSNGTDHWLFGWNTMSSNYELVKVNLN